MWNNLGFLYLITNNLKKARISFNSALQRKANSFFPTFNLALVNARQNKIKLARQLIEKSLNLCKDDTIKDKLYTAIAKIALRKEKDGLQNINNILETAKNSSLSLEQEVRCGVLESAQILAEHPDFLGMKEAVNILEQALQN